MALKSLSLIENQIEQLVTSFGVDNGHIHSVSKLLFIILLITGSCFMCVKPVTST